MLVISISFLLKMKAVYRLVRTHLEYLQQEQKPMRYVDLNFAKVVMKTYIKLWIRDKICNPEN